MSASGVLGALPAAVKRETRVNPQSCGLAWGKARLGAPGLGG